MRIQIQGRNRAQISLLQSDGARYALATLPRRVLRFVVVLGATILAHAGPARQASSEPPNCSAKAPMVPPLPPH
jgi:hypothetical protein